MSDTLFTPLQRAGIIGGIGTIATVGMATSLSIPLLSLVLEDRGISNTMIGVNTAVAGVAAVVVTPIVPHLTRVMGTTWLAGLFIAVAALCFPAFYYIEAFWAWFPLRFIFNAAITGLFIISEFWINASAPEARRGAIMGVYATTLSAGFAAGPILLGWTGSETALPFMIGAVIMAMGAVPLLAMREAAPDIRGERIAPFLPFLTIVPMATMAAFVFGAVESAGYAFFALFGERVGYTENAAVLIITMMAAGGILIHVPLGLIADRVSRRLLLVLCAVIGLVGAIVIPFLTSAPLALYTLVFFWGGTIAGLYTVGLIHLGSRFRGSALASANAAFVFMYSVGMLIGPASAGRMMDWLGPSGFTGTLALFFALYLALALPRMVFAARTDR